MYLATYNVEIKQIKAKTQSSFITNKIKFTLSYIVDLRHTNSSNCPLFPSLYSVNLPAIRRWNIISYKILAKSLDEFLYKKKMEL